MSDLIKRNIGVYIYILFFLFILVWGIMLQFLPDKETMLNYAFNIGNGALYIIGGIIGYIYAKCDEANHLMKKAVTYLVAGQIAWGIGSLVWAYYNIYLHIEVPFPSAADFFYVMYSLCVVMAIWYFLDFTNAQITTHNVRDTIVIVFISYSVIIFLFGRLPVTSNVTFSETLSNFFYPLIETFALSLSYTAFRMSGPKARRSMMLITLAVFVQLIGDILFMQSGMMRIYWNGGLTDIAYSISGFITTLAIVSFGTCPFRSETEAVPLRHHK